MTTKFRALPILPYAIAFILLMLLTSMVPVGLTQSPDPQPKQKPAKTPQKITDESGEHGSWTLHTIGAATAGVARRIPPQLQIRGASEGYGPTRDSLHFFAQETSGDFEISVRIDDVKDSGLGGLMVRVAGTDGREPYFSISTHPASDHHATVRTLYRPQQEPQLSQKMLEPVVLAFPIFLKLQRVGSVFISSYSNDGYSYREQLRVDSKGSRLAERDLNVGMVQSSEKSKVVATAVFEMPVLQSTEPQVSQLVSVGVKEPLVGGLAGAGAIVRSLPPGLSSSPDDVAYLKSDSRYVKVPKKLTFDRGRPTATFEIQTSAVKSPTSANVTVLLNGQKKTVRVNVLPREAVTSITIRPSQIVTNEPRAVATVDLVNPAPSGGTKVRVSSTGRDVRMPSEVIVPAGERSVSFDLAGWGLASGNTVVTAAGGGATRQGFIDLGSIGLPERSLNECSLQALRPDIATDGQRVYLRNDTPEGARVFLTGYRYNDSPPSRLFPQGEGREKTYCGCQHVALQAVPDFDGGSTTRPYFVVPMDAPSGDYTVVVKSKEGDCKSGGIRAEDCHDDGCTAVNLFVAPSYMVSRLNRMDINANSEDVADSPAEMNFTFGSFSGTPIGQGNNTLALVEFAGSYPGGPKGAGHLTNADNTQLFPNLPLFIGRESRMINIECREECASVPAGREAECLSICSDFVASGRFSNHFEFQFGGAEFDSSPSKWYGYVAGVGAAALGCAISVKAGHPKAGCTASAGAGKWLSDEINKALEDNDDKLGTASQIYNHSLGGFEWGPPDEQPPLALTQDREGGDINIYVQNFRVGGPRILQYKVTLKSMTVLEGYDLGSCPEPNEIFLNSRAFLYEGGSELGAAERFPSSNGVWKLKTNETEDFGGVPFVLKQSSFTAENAPESPLLFVEFGVWEDDEDKDLMGLFSDTIFLPDLLALEPPFAVDEVSPEGLFIRRAKMEQFVQVHGYEGSDNHCFSGPSAVAGDSDELQGRVNLVYEIEVTWLKRALR